MKIAIVNDSLIASEVLRRLIDGTKEHEVLWMAENGAEAVINCKAAKPDLILMDLLMPVMDGVEATRRIMRATPCAILVVTGSVTGNSSMVFDAMGAGALDAVATPVIGGHSREETGAGEELLRKINTICKLIGCNNKAEGRQRPGREGRAARLCPGDRKLVAIGASTGGPQAITAILRTLPEKFEASVVVVQHMDRKFTSGLTTWLNGQIKSTVKLIATGDRPLPGTVHVPTTDHHLVLTASRTFHYSTAPEDNFYHPSVDVFFQSVAAFWPGKVLAVLLTGMGRDGAAGLLTLKKMGHHTIAQDRETSVVYGMPKAAGELGAANEILPLDEIGRRVAAFV